jgi:hypothetical protein
LRETGELDTLVYMMEQQITGCDKEDDGKNNDYIEKNKDYSDSE